MAETSGFFRSVSGDRKYTTDWLAKWVSSFIGSGVYNGELALSPGGGMSVSLPAGKAWIKGYYYRNDAPITLPIANADGVLHRKDTVVLRWNVNERSITVRVLQGSFASNPIAPEIVRDLEIYDLKLAEISIPAGTTAITPALITDTRLNKTVCGIVTGVVNQVDTTTFYNQIADDLAQFKSTQQTDFEVWFDSVKDILGEDEAGNLLTLINEHKADANAHITTYDHSKTGTVHEFTGTGPNGKAFIKSDFIVGDTFTVNGQSVIVKLQNGESPAEDFFKDGCWVQFIYDDSNKQLNFSAGGAKKIPNTLMGRLIISLSVYDGGDLGTTRVRIKNESLGMNLIYTPDALGKVTVELQGNKTYSIDLIDVPEPYYGEAASVNIAFDSDNALSLQLKGQPDIVGVKINWTTRQMTYIDGCVGWTEMKMVNGDLETNSWVNSWLLKDIRPCVMEMRTGVVQYYLKRTGFMQYDYSLQENGTPSDITSGNDGDVYIEHPLVYICLENAMEGTDEVLKIHFSKQQLPGYTAVVHSVGNSIKNTVHYPAYGACNQSDVPRVLSNTLPYPLFQVKSPRIDTSYILQIQYRDISYLWCLYMLVFKSMFLKNLGGTLAASTYANTKTGEFNSRPLCWGNSSNIKLFGMENPFATAMQCFYFGGSRDYDMGFTYKDLYYNSSQNTSSYNYIVPKVSYTGASALNGQSLYALTLRANEDVICAGIMTSSAPSTTYTFLRYLYTSSESSPSSSTSNKWFITGVKVVQHSSGGIDLQEWFTYENRANGDNYYPKLTNFLCWKVYRH